MTRKDRIKRYSRELLALSLQDGQLEAERVEAVLNALERTPPRNYLSIMRAYRKRVEKEIARSRALIEFAGGLEDSEVDRIIAVFSERYNRRITPVTRPNPELIAGLRIRIDCDVYENSVASHLRALSRAVA